jgi:cobalamin biosynthesis protein CobT
MWRSKCKSKGGQARSNYADNFNRRFEARLRSVKVISYAKKNQEWRRQVK